MARPLTEPPGAFAGAAVPRPGDCRASDGAIRASNGAIRGIGQHHDSPPAPGDCRASSGATPIKHAESKNPAECWRHSLMTTLNPGTLPSAGHTPWGLRYMITTVPWSRRHDQEKTERERQRQNGDDDMAGGEVGGREEGGKRLAGRWRKTTKKRTDAQAQTHKRTNAYTQTST